jgi:hypothetical protein
MATDTIVGRKGRPDLFNIEQGQSARRRTLEVDA